MALSLPDARQLSDEVLEALRLRALRGCELGFTQAEVANLQRAGYNAGFAPLEDSVQRYVTQFLDQEDRYR